MGTMRLLVLPFVALVLVAACSSSSECTLVACQTGVHYQSPIRFTGAADSVALTVCRNGVCAHGSASEGGCSLSGSIDVTCAISPANASSTTIAFDVPAAIDDVKSGDTYTFRAQRGATNETLVDVTKPATYATLQPNGPSCPPTCKYVDLT